ncbi:hypothetical protein [Streptosporangium roseum]|uniref:hypothetical protein n=1 Tax=Streptosporangium roseum TaxID=2001 RepID=UPI00146B2208|nr:hypothetical protein [Streptosporangium roseum]
MPLRRRRLCSASSPVLVPIAAVRSAEPVVAIRSAAARASPMEGSLRAYAAAITSMAQS